MSVTQASATRSPLTWSLVSTRLLPRTSFRTSPANKILAARTFHQATWTTVALLNGLVLVSYISQLRRAGTQVEQATIEACEHRLRPILMAASITVFSLGPMQFASGPGSEIQKPLAVVVVGGLITSTLSTLLVMPSMYRWFDAGRARRHETD